MALKTRLACCLLLSLFVFVEIAASAGTCDAIIDVTFLIDFSSSLQSRNYSFEISFFQRVLYSLFPSPNDVHVNIRFYHSFVLEYLPVYGSFENTRWLWKILQTGGTHRREEEGEDVITALIAASRPMPETDCRRKRGGRRIVVVVADAVDKSVLKMVPPSEFRNLMEERGVQIVAFAIGTNSTLGVLDDILDPNHGDRIIKLDNFDKLMNQDVIDDVLNEFCEVTPEMTNYKERMSASFRANFTYNGHAYYLSRAEFDNMTQAHQTCSLAGGYLAVMNDQQEYDAMKQYFTDNDPGYGFYEDGSNALTEVIWTLLSGATFPIIDWPDPPKPDEGGKDCLLWSRISHYMLNECDDQNYRYLFLCEVPETC